MPGNSSRGAIVFATGFEEETISRHFAPEESGTLLEYVLDSVWTIADELFVVFSQEPKLSLIEAISPFGVKIITTARKQNPLLSIIDAFRASKSMHSLLVTERVPLLKPNVALCLFESSIDSDAAIPKWTDGRSEPMLAVYRKNALIRAASSSGLSFGPSISTGVGLVADKLFDVKYVSVENELVPLDPELDSFFQVFDKNSLLSVREKASVKKTRVQIEKLAL